MRLFTAFALTCALLAQQETITVQQKDNSQVPHFEVRQTLASTAGKITVQACTFCNQFVGEYIVVSSSVACNVTFYKNGTVATTTAATVTEIADIATNGYTPPNAFTASNSTGGTVIGPITPVAAGGSVTFMISDWYLGNGWPTSKNYRVETDCTTGTTDIVIRFRGTLP